MTSQNQNIEKKKKGIIRWEAIIPFTIICALIGIYFHLFFDTHLRKAMEWGGYQALGAEVNIGNVETSVLSASLRIQDIQVTDAEKPAYNSFEVGDIRFSMLWDALLRAKAVVNEAVVEQIKFGTKRKHIGKVKPPAPEPSGPSATEKLKSEILQEAQGQAGDNLLGDLIAMLGGSDAQDQLNKLQAQLPSKALLEKFEVELKSKKDNWDQRLKTLPQGKDIQALNDRLNKIKYKDFKNAQEVQSSLKELDQLFKDGDAMYKQVQTAGDDLSKDLKGVEAQYKVIEAQIKTDIKTLEQHFRIPKFDAKSLTTAMFNRYLGPYKLKFIRYQAMLEKYIPPNLLKKNKKDEEVVIQPHPREKGISYEFGRQNSYPLFWVKRTAVSSQAGSSPEAGNIKGEILDITSNQRLIGRPTVATLAGDFPGMEIFGFLLRLSLNNTKPLSEVEYNFKVASYPLQGQDLINSPDVKISFTKAQGAFSVQGKVIGLKDISVDMRNDFSKIDYAISAKNEIADQMLKAIFGGIPQVDLTVKGQGIFPHIPLSINSNLGPELQKGLEKQVQAKIDEAKKRIQATIDAEIGKQKAQIDAQLKQLQGQLDNEVKKAQAQLNEQKKLADERLNTAKKDAENQGKKALEKEGQKAVDELKKKFGF